MAGVEPTAVRLRLTAARGQNGEYDLDAILNREIYPAIHAIKATVNEVTTLLNRFVPRVVSAATEAITDDDENALICMDSSGACTVTFDSVTAATYTVGASIAMMQYGAGQLTFSGSGLTIRTAETQKTRKQYSSIFITKLRNDEWFLTGDMELA